MVVETWFVQLRDEDGVVLARAELPIAKGALEVLIDPIQLFGADGPGLGRVLHIRREDGTVALWPCESAEPLLLDYFHPSMLR